MWHEKVQSVAKWNGQHLALWFHLYMMSHDESSGLLSSYGHILVGKKKRWVDWNFWQIFPSSNLAWGVPCSRMFWRISLEEIKASLNISRRGMWGKPQRKWQQALFLSQGWIPDCLQTTAEREHISEGNLITRRRSHGTSSCKRVLFRCDAPARLLFGSPSTLGNFYERNALLQCMTPLPCNLFKANFSVKHDLTSPDCIIFLPILE